LVLRFHGHRATVQPGAAPRSHRRHCITGRFVIIGIKGEPLATDIISEQTFNVGKTDEIAQRIVPPLGSEISFVTSAHDGSRSGSCPKRRAGVPPIIEIGANIKST
jgi:hypothetical protein